MEHPPELIEAIFRTRHPAWATGTVAILNDRNGRLGQRGTGTLFGIGQNRFLVTASHVVVAEKPDVKLRLSLVGQSGIPVPLAGESFVSHQPGGAKEDCADVAVAELGEMIVNRLGDCSFLRQIDIMVDDDLGEDYYFFTGFPTAWAKLEGEPNDGLELLTYCTQPYTGSTSALPNYRSDWHILLALGGGLQQSGERAKMPLKLDGISGCSIWRSYFVRDEKEGQSRVVAVQTGTYSNGKRTIIKGTRWALVVKMIFDFYPQLRGAMSLRLPRHNA